MAHNSIISNPHLILIFCLIACTLSFSIQTEPMCKINGKFCGSDSQCCSGWCKDNGPFFNNSCAAVSNCGGNCPAGNCRGCSCPTTKLIVDLNTFCTPSISTWQPSCCKCIANAISGGNAHFQRQAYERETGVFPIAWSILTGGKCLGTDVCDWRTNRRCAEILYQTKDKWGTWADAAVKCGC